MSSYDGKLGQERAKITTKGLGRGARLWGKKWQIYERKYKITKEKQQKNMRKIVYLLEFKLLQKKKENSRGNRENVWIRMKKKNPKTKVFWCENIRKPNKLKRYKYTNFMKNGQIHKKIK